MKKNIKKFFSDLFGSPYGENTGADASFGTKLKKILTRDIVAKLLCILAAFCLWFYVIDAQSSTFETTVSGVEITFDNLSLLPSNYTVIQGAGQQADVTFSGKRSDLNKLRASDIRASVDLSGIASSGTYPLEVAVKAPGDVSVSGINPGLIYVYIDRSISKQIRIEDRHTGIMSMAGLSIGEAEMNIDHITVKGPASEIDAISYAYIDPNIDTVSDTVSMTVPIKLADAGNNEITNLSGFVSLSTSEVIVKYPVVMEKKVKVIPSFKNDAISEEYINCEIRPEYVTVKGDKEIVESISDGVYTEEIATANMGGVSERQVSIAYPSGLESVSNQSCKAVLAIRDYTERTVRVPYKKLTDFPDIPDGYTAQVINRTQSVASDLELVFCGPRSVIEGKEPDYSIDILVPDGVGESGDYSCRIKVNVKSANCYVKSTGDFAFDVRITENGGQNEGPEE